MYAIAQKNWAPPKKPSETKRQPEDEVKRRRFIRDARRHSALTRQKIYRDTEQKRITTRRKSDAIVAPQRSQYRARRREHHTGL
jgi:hypothetical protein